MAAKDLFPTDLTDGERAAGFNLKEIDNPDAHYVGQAPTIPAVVCADSPSRRIVKMKLPGDRIGYQLQRFGRYSFANVSSPPEWLPDLSFSVHDPVFAVQYFQTPLAQLRGLGMRIIEVSDGLQ